MDQAIRIGIALTGIGLFACGVLMSFRGLTSEAIATYGAAIVVLIFAFLARFKRFKGLGVEAELWEDKQEEAAQLVDRLKNISAALGDPIMAMTSRMGRWDSGFSRREHHEFMERLHTALVAAGIDLVELERMKKDWHRYNTYDLAEPIRNSLYNAITKKVQGLNREVADLAEKGGSPNHQRKIEIEEKVAELGVAHRQLAEIFNEISAGNSGEVPNQLNRWFENAPGFERQERETLKEEIRDRIDDLTYYIQNREFRRLDVWLAEDSV